MGNGSDGLEDEDEAEADSGGDEHSTNSILDDDGAEERPARNEDEDVEEGQTRPQDASSSSGSNGAIRTPNSARTRRARRRRRNGLDVHVEA